MINISLGLSSISKAKMRSRYYIRLIFCAFGVKLKAGKTQFSRKTQRIFRKLNQNFSKTQFCETFVLKRRTVLLQKYVFKKLKS